MTNKNIALATITSWVVFLVAMTALEESVDGFTTFAFYLSMVGIWVFGCWGLLRLLKSDK